MTKLRTRHAALALSLAAVAAAGCGSSSSSQTKNTPAASTPATPSTPSTGTSTTATKPGGAFGAKLNALCKQGNQAAAKAGRSLSETAKVAEQFLPKFEALTPPTELKATYAEFLSNTKAEITAAKAGDKAKLGELVTKDHQLDAKLGAPDCG